MDTPPTTPIKTPFDLSDDESPKKYIRTYAGDMEILKKGGTPDLKPLEPAPPPAPAQTPPPPPKLVPPPPKPAPPPPPSKPIPPPPPPPPKPVPPPPPPPPKPIPPPPPPPKLVPPPPPPPVVRRPEPTPVQAPEKNPAPLKTYADDFLQRVKERRASKVTVLAAEQDAGNTKEVLAESPRGSVFLIIVGAVLLVVGGIGVYFAYTSYTVKKQTVAPAPVVTAPIFVDEKQNVSAATTSELMLLAVDQSLSQPLAQNAVRLLYTGSATTTGGNIFSILVLPAPNVVTRNINAAQSMAGIVNTSDAPSVFFILSVASYPDTFAGMLSWEPRMQFDLTPIFPSFPQTVVVAPVVVAPVATTTVATSTKKSGKKSTTKAPASVPPPVVAPPPPQAAPYTGSFRDEVVDNHDVRAYRDAEGRMVLLYGYWNKTTLVIARDSAAFTEILRRLATTQ